MSNRARVLFVDDEKRVLRSMRGMFRREFDLFFATNGAAAVKIASEHAIDVIVADQRMPGMKGIEVLSRVKTLSPNTVRILLTGYADPTAVEGSINIGEVFRFLSKPCLPKLLRETLSLAVDAAKTEIQSQPIRRANGQADVDIARPPTAPFAQDMPPILVSKCKPAEDSRHEAPAAQAAAKEIGVVLYTVDAQFAETAIRALSKERSTTLATSLIKVMQTIEREKTGVLITDVATNDTRLQNIIGALKHYVPELVTVVVSGDRDSSDMINLINYGQIYRYLPKPVSPMQLRSDIDAAAVKHVDLRNNPESLKRHAVTPFPIRGSSPRLPALTLDAIQDIGVQRLAARHG